MASSGCCGNVPRMAAALYLWIVMEISCSKNRSPRGSPEVLVRWRPRTDKNSKPATFIGPIVSKASGQNSYVRASAEYFSIFLLAATSVMLPGELEDCGRYEEAKVSLTVTSQVKYLPPRHGVKVMPSWRLASVLKRPDGSLVAWKFAFRIALYIKSLMA